MKAKWGIGIVILGAVGLAVVGTARHFPRRPGDAVLDGALPASRPPRIHPDYRDLVVPPNIAPLNFRVEEPGDLFFVRIRSLQGTPVEIVSRSGEVEIPPGGWRRLLMENRGNTLTIDVYARSDAAWRRFESLTNRIAEEEIDSHIAYRRLKPDALYYRAIGVYQRRLETYEESAVLDGRWFGGGCVHCHAFQDRDPSRLSLNFRGGYGDASLFAQDGEIHTLAARLGHAAWHPSGKVVVFSRFDIQLFYHTERIQTRDAMDSDSDLGYYRLDLRKWQTAAPIADPTRLETQPAWSPDGKYLYFASAPKLWPDYVTFPDQYYAQLRYDLKRVRYDVEADQWGAVETVLSASRTGKSNINPRVSPDGRYLLFSMCDHGDFALYQPESDLYLMNLENGDYWKLECNSEFAESWHCWSSNGRWIIFSSKRPTGIFTRLYLSHVDQAGRASKPFLLPQRDPGFYDDFLSMYTLPEFITGPVATSPRALLAAVRDTHRVQLDGTLGATPQVRSPGRRPLGPE